MRTDINAHIYLCHTFAIHKGNVHSHVPILNYPVPAQPWAIDLLTLPPTEKGNKYLLVAVDNFSRFSILVPQDKSALTIARAIVNNVICLFVTHKTLLSDNGAEFVNQILDALCKQLYISKCTVLPYKYSSNGLVEHLNRKILNFLRSHVQPTDTVWDLYMPQVIVSLNAQIHKSISETPHFVMFCSDKRLPSDLFSESPSISR